jgi:hypothetical protein
VTIRYLWQLLDSLQMLKVSVVSLAPSLHQIHSFPEFELNVSLDVRYLFHHSKHLPGNTVRRRRGSGEWMNLVRRFL